MKRTKMVSLLMAAVVATSALAISPVSAQRLNDDVQDFNRDERRFNQQRTNTGRNEFAQREREDCVRIRQDIQGGQRGARLPNLCCSQYGICLRPVVAAIG